MRHNSGEQPQRATRLTPSELIYLAAAVFLLTWQLFIPPYVGMADNGDFERVMGGFGIGHRPGIAERSYFHYFVRSYDVRESLRHNLPFPTSEDVFIYLAIPINRVIFGSRTFDLRSLGFVHAAAFLGLLGVLTVVSRKWRPGVRWTVLVLTLLTFADTAYVAYFNSFYCESASILFLLASLIAAIAAGRNPSLGRVLIFILAGACFVLAKPQNVLGGIILAVLCLRLATGTLRSPARGWAFAGAVAFLAATAIGVISTPRHIREWTYEVAVFWELLGHSPDPAEDLRELRLDPGLARYAGLHVWSPGAPSIHDPEFRSSFIDQISYGRIARFYLAHPKRGVALANRVGARALTARPALGNYEEFSGASPGALSHKFDLFSRLKSYLLPRRAWSLLLFFGLYCAGLLAAWLRSSDEETRWICEILCGVVIMALTQFVIVAMTQGDIDAAKHLLLFKALVDVLIISVAAFAAALLTSPLTRMRRSR